ncbi:hypothetical protein LCL96_12455 [Rossellomorea aquimaris]|uniref:hypothetical protein n=1 Tax=Rossellomorea aquimaris TaxID=189382 RepID=UPI001CD3A502|nr:hypothetical protein [Rossellomorea aquimaris]MCA1059759.1 hypothetical protein [Rossellomorea aquimaris]
MSEQRLRLFFVFAIRNEAETSFGITERFDNETVYIASLYCDKRLSRREAFDKYSHHIGSLLETGEQAKVITNDMTVRSKNRLRFPRHDYHVSSQKVKTWEVRQLSFDAMRRKTSITEKFN